MKIRDDYTCPLEIDHPEETALNAKKALDYFRKNDLPIFHVQHINTQAVKG